MEQSLLSASSICGKATIIKLPLAMNIFVLTSTSNCNDN